MATATRQDPKAESTRPDEPEFDLYTIPSYSSWFRWNDIHETERAAMRDFFDGSSITRTPKIYKEYRDFMINRYREDPSTRLTFTELRKSLVGDVTSLHKVFQFLNQWGLINFGADSARIESEREEKDEVRVEDGSPNGIRVVATPNSSRPIPAPYVGGNRPKLSPLASYSDVFGELGKRKGILCGSCGGTCESGRYQHDKDSYVLCVKCFKDGKYGNKSRDDFKLHGGSVSGSKQTDAWTEAETLLLLESVSKHGDDWDLVAQSVKSKNKLECISKLIELPLGEFISSYSLVSDSASGLSGNGDGRKEVFPSLPEQQDVIKRENIMSEQANGNEQKGDDGDEGPPLKKQCASSSSGSGISIMKQVARISSMVGDDITATAAKAAFAALCDEASCPSDTFNDDEDFVNILWPAMDQAESDRAHMDGDIEEGRQIVSEASETNIPKNNVPLALRLRATVAAALGAAAAHAKLLANEEDQEIETLVGTIIETQLKKLQCKTKDLDELEVIMEKEYGELEEVKRSLAEQRVDILARGIGAGRAKARDHTFVKTQNANLP